MFQMYCFVDPNYPQMLEARLPMSNEPIKTSHKGIEITYNVSTNMWMFTLRGKERRSESLLNAQEAIDKPAPKAKHFERQKTFITRNYDGIKPAEVTSEKEVGEGYQREFVVMAPDWDGKPARSTIRIDDLRAFDDHNREIFEQWTALEKQEKAIAIQQQELIKKMHPFNPPEIA